MIKIKEGLPLYRTDCPGGNIIKTTIRKISRYLSSPVGGGKTIVLTND